MKSIVKSCANDGLGKVSIRLIINFIKSNSLEKAVVHVGDLMGFSRNLDILIKYRGLQLAENSLIYLRLSVDI